MEEYKHPANLLSLKPPEINWEIKSSQQYQNKTSFAMNNGKSFYSSQNYAIKAISILSDLANSILKVSDTDNGPQIIWLGKTVPEHNNRLELYFTRIHKKKKKQPKKYSPFRLCCPLQTNTRCHNFQS